MKIGVFVKKKREARRITQRQLANYAQVSRTLINRIEKGDQNLRLVTLNKILNVFGYRTGIVSMQNKKNRIE